eukprot:9793465-Alexandrium_andersonii.AAC.1
MHWTARGRRLGRRGVSAYAGGYVAQGNCEAQPAQQHLGGRQRLGRTTYAVAELALRVRAALPCEGGHAAERPPGQTQRLEADAFRLHSWAP